MTNKRERRNRLYACATLYVILQECTVAKWENAVCFSLIWVFAEKRKQNRFDKRSEGCAE